MFFLSNNWWLKSNGGGLCGEFADIQGSPIIHDSPFFTERLVTAMMYLRHRNDAAPSEAATREFLSRTHHCGAHRRFVLAALAIIAVFFGASNVPAEPFATPTAWTASTDDLSDEPGFTSSLSKPDLSETAALEGDLPQTDHPTLPPSLGKDLRSDRIWLINTRSITHHTRHMDLQQPDFTIERLDEDGQRRASSLDEYLSTMDPTRPRIIYIHGYRRDACKAVTQGLYVYRQVARHRHGDQPFDWVIWSWPSDASAALIADAREKAQRTDSQGLYVAWLLRQHHLHAQPTALLGFSFGGRIVSGALHALAGGVLGGRSIGEPKITGANIDVGLLAPAVDATWMMPNGPHGLASLNMNGLVLLYNRRDIALRFFKFVSQEPGGQALGYSGPISFAPRHDGSVLPVRAFDCAQTVGNHHSEKLYYEQAVCAGHEMGSLIHSTMVID